MDRQGYECFHCPGGAWRPVRGSLDPVYAVRCQYRHAQHADNQELPGSDPDRRGCRIRTGIQKRVLLGRHLFVDYDPPENGDELPAASHQFPPGIPRGQRRPLLPGGRRTPPRLADRGQPLDADRRYGHSAVKGLLPGAWL